MAGENDVVEDRGDELPEGFADPEAEDEGAVAAKADEGADDEGADDEGADDGEGASAKADEADEPRIPKSRFDEAVKKARDRADEAERKLKAREAADAAAHQTNELSTMAEEISALEDEYEDCLMDGRKEDAAAKRRQLNQARDKLSEARTTAAANMAEARATERMTFNNTLDQLERDYPALDGNSEHYSAELEEEVAMVTQGIMHMGVSKSEAVVRAARYVLGTSTAPDAATMDSRAKPADEVRAAREASARKKAAAAMRQQPTDATLAGLDSDKLGKDHKAPELDMRRISQAKFDKLTDEEKARMRGDVVAG